MITDEMVKKLEDDAYLLFADADRMNKEISFRGEELDRILAARKGQNAVSIQVLKAYFSERAVG